MTRRGALPSASTSTCAIHRGASRSHAVEASSRVRSGWRSVSSRRARAACGLGGRTQRPAATAERAHAGKAGDAGSHRPAGLGAQEHVGTGGWNRDVVRGRLVVGRAGGDRRARTFERVAQGQLARRAQAQPVRSSRRLRSWRRSTARAAPRSAPRRPPRCVPGTDFSSSAHRYGQSSSRLSADSPVRPTSSITGSSPRRLASSARAAREVSSTASPCDSATRSIDAARSGPMRSAQAKPSSGTPGRRREPRPGRARAPCAGARRHRLRRAGSSWGSRRRWRI